LSSTITQGVAVATGLQSSFDWRGVAVSAIATGAGYSASNGVQSWNMGDAFNRAAGGVTAGVMSTLLRDGSVGHNLGAIAADVIGSTIGNSIAEQVAGLNTQKTFAQDGQQTAKLTEAGLSAQEDGRDATMAQMLGVGPSSSNAPTVSGTLFPQPGEFDPTSISASVAPPVTAAQHEYLRTSFAGPGAASSRTGALTNLYDLSDKANFSDYLNAVNQSQVNGQVLDPQDISTSKALLFNYYGYSMGEEKYSSAESGSVKEQLAGSLSDQSSPAFTRALGAFSQTSTDQQQQRYDFYSNIQTVYNVNGQATNGRYVDMSQSDRTIRINWDPTFANTANAVGVTADEALRKTDFEVYHAATSAAFNTDGVNSININGAWRPSPSDYAAITGRTSPLPNAHSPHISSRAIDINMINDIRINNGGWDNNHNVIIDEPNIVEDFTDNLAAQSGVRQIFQPWSTAIKITNGDNHGLNPNLGISANDRLHGNHLHFGF
ncbi:hypothetical protein, partial [Collimonas sp.]|uniref:hypothetical protein n=1 Tax=Collimonas sp. TaxID=1963772 RepID=UPI002CD6F48C